MCPGTASARGSGAPAAGSVPTGLIHPLLRARCSKLSCKSQSLLFRRTQVCSLLVALVQRTESVLAAVAGEFAIQSPAGVQTFSHQRTRTVCGNPRALARCSPFVSVPLCPSVCELLCSWRTHWKPKSANRNAFVC